MPAGSRSVAVVRFAFGTDESTDVTASVRDDLARRGELVEAVEDAPWPEVGRTVAEAVAQGRADLGVVMCWTGTGVSIAANKVPGVRAALCTDAETARGARRWNDANVLAMGLRLTTAAMAGELVEAFVSTGVDAAEGPTIATVEPR
jgi:ribose 5-phosphate isomerase B